MPTSVIKLLEQEYEKAKNMKWVYNPVAYALYQVWKMVDREGTTRRKYYDKDIKEDNQ